MKKIELEIGEEIQGTFELKKLNFLLVFQVNCPGCFSYAVPFFNQLYDEFSVKGVSFLGISTAFEDFDKNTFSHTKALLKEGILVGETKKFMSNQGIKTLPYALKFPVAMDKFQDNHDDLESVIDKISQTNPNYLLWTEADRAALRNRVVNYFKSLDKIALTFTLNHLRGTPSFILFDDSYEILGEWFGHVPLELISEKINQFN